MPTDIDATIVSTSQLNSALAVRDGELNLLGEAVAATTQPGPITRELESKGSIDVGNGASWRRANPYPLPFEVERVGAFLWEAAAGNEFDVSLSAAVLSGSIATEDSFAPFTAESGRTLTLTSTADLGHWIESFNCELTTTAGITNLIDHNGTVLFRFNNATGFEGIVGTGSSAPRTHTYWQETFLSHIINESPITFNVDSAGQDTRWTLTIINNGVPSPISVNTDTELTNGESITFSGSGYVNHSFTIARNGNTITATPSGFAFDNNTIQYTLRIDKQIEDTWQQRTGSAYQGIFTRNNLSTHYLNMDANTKLSGTIVYVPRNNQVEITADTEMSALITINGKQYQHNFHMSATQLGLYDTKTKIGAVNLKWSKFQVGRWSGRKPVLENLSQLSPNTLGWGVWRNELNRDIVKLDLKLGVKELGILEDNGNYKKFEPGGGGTVAVGTSGWGTNLLSTPIENIWNHSWKELELSICQVKLIVSWLWLKGAITPDYYEHRQSVEIIRIL